ncbi:MAG: NAD-dependent succinate-semialdehyde dehydrogenase [Schleiferiaceae bacterium]|nr:NAD-dependent succinate-semialdehyde dehydrogenase [Schleiferiaceae bacterium]
MTFESINPHNLTPLQSYTSLTAKELEAKITLATSAQEHWSALSVTEREAFLIRVAAELRNASGKHAEMITLEMGKPISESLAEIEKCAWVCEYYAQNAAALLQVEEITTDAEYSQVQYDPLGVILGIMPWNFPYWQVFRFAAPTLMAGNAIVLKHAPNVFGCAALIAQAFEKAGLPNGVYTNLVVHHNTTEQLLADPRIAGVSLTGSVRAGSAVAALAGKYIKPSLLELGGSNAFIVCSDADIPKAVTAALYGRMRNAGQSCIAAKRLIVMADVYDAFRDGFVNAVSQLVAGDPLDEATEIGPLARVDLAENLERQLRESVAAGAKILFGGKRKNAFFQPTILENATPSMAAFCEETFGPLAVLTKADTIEQALSLAANTSFGLGLSIFTKKPEQFYTALKKIKDGAVFFNSVVKSDPRLPFGGTGISGYGRELGKSGIHAFVNEKVVYIHEHANIERTQ